jgi:hypothetical protein
VIVMRLDFPVVLSDAETFKIPLASIVKGNFNLGDTTRHRRNARELKLAEQVVMLGASTLSFVHLNEYTGLVVRVSGEDFGLFGGNGGDGDAVAVAAAAAAAAADGGNGGVT